MSHYIYMLVNAVANLSRVTAVCSGVEYCRCPGSRLLMPLKNSEGEYVT